MLSICRLRVERMQQMGYSPASRVESTTLRWRDTKRAQTRIVSSKCEPLLDLGQPPQNPEQLDAVRGLLRNVTMRYNMRCEAKSAVNIPEAFAGEGHLPIGAARRRRWHCEVHCCPLD